MQCSNIARARCIGHIQYSHKCNFGLGFPEIQPQNLICYNWPSMFGNFKTIHCGIPFGMFYWPPISRNYAGYRWRSTLFQWLPRVSWTIAQTQSKTKQISFCKSCSATASRLILVTASWPSNLLKSTNTTKSSTSYSHHVRAAYCHITAL